MVQYIYTLGADLISQERNGRTYTYLYDGHGSVVGLMSESGSVTDTYTYDAFGNLLKSTGRTANNYRYCGEQFDSTTGLYYLRARYMDTSTGRFISQDSYAGSVYDPVSLHKYLYCNSDPVNNVDPSGYCSNVIAPNCATVMLAEMQAAVATAAMAVWNWFLSLLPTIMVAATGFSAILLDNPAFIDISEQFLSGNMSIYDLQQQIIETFQKIDQSVRDYIYEARNGGSSNNSSGGSSNGFNSSGSSSPQPPDPNKLNHIFEKAQHNLQEFLNSFGGNQSEAYSAVEKAAQEYVTQNNITGIIDKTNQITIDVSGYNITFRGNVEDGILKLGTFFIK